jgi:hypothetical protein
MKKIKNEILINLYYVFQYLGGIILVLSIGSCVGFFYKFITNNFDFFISFSKFLIKYYFIVIPVLLIDILYVFFFLIKKISPP